MLLTWQTSQTPLNGLRVGCITPNRKPKRASKYIKIFHFKLRLFARKSVQNNWKESCFSARASRQNKNVTNSLFRRRRIHSSNLLKYVTWRANCAFHRCDTPFESHDKVKDVGVLRQLQMSQRISTGPSSVFGTACALSPSENVLKIWWSAWNQLR